MRHHFSLVVALLLSIPSSAGNAPPERAGVFVAEPASLTGAADKSRTYSDGRPGFLVITTNDLTHRLKSLQRYMTHKADNMGFRVFVATENDWAGKSPTGKQARALNACPGRIAGLDILHYLKSSYRRLGLKYVIFIGDARPVNGTVPMLQINHHKTAKRTKPLTKLKDGSVVTNWGSVISDYPYVDLNTDWDANHDGILDSGDDPNPAHTRVPEVYVGRIPYYGETSTYGKAADVDVILDRIIRYDLEKDICWRYNFPVDPQGHGAEHMDYYEKMGINYFLISRFKTKLVGLPGVLSRTGREHIGNLEQILDYTVGFKGCHSHGGAFGMEGFRSAEVAQLANDKHPTVLTLGACSVGAIEPDRNLTYTLLRFQSVAVSGGTGSVTGYGGDGRYAAEKKMTKSDLLLAGKSVGEAHWGWYGALYHKAKRVPMTGAKINIYGDPSVRPLRAGPKPPYPFIAKPVAGHFDVAVAGVAGLKSHVITLANDKNAPTTIAITTTRPWLTAEPTSILLASGQSRAVRLSVRPAKFTPGVHEARAIFEADTGYTCFRRFVFKVPRTGVKALYNFDNQSGSTKNVVGNPMRTMDDFAMCKDVANFAKLKQKNPKLKRPIPIVPGRFGKGLNANYPATGYFYPFEREDVTVALSVRFNSFKPIVKQPFILDATGFFRLSKTDTELILTIENHGGLGQTEVKKALRTKVAWKPGTWYHLAFTIDQATGATTLFVDGAKVASATMPAYQYYHTSGVNFGKWDGVYDDLFLYNDALDAAQLTALKDGRYALKPAPAKNVVVSPSGVRFDFVTGLPPGSIHVVCYPESTPAATQMIKADRRGVFAAPELKPCTNYRWKITANDGSFVSDAWSFRTGKELIRNGRFMADANGWSGKVAIVSLRKGPVRKQLRITGRATTKALDPIQPNRIYVLSASVNPQRKKQCRVRLYYLDETRERTLTQRDIRFKQRGHQEVEFAVLPDSPAVGKDLFAAFDGGEGKDASPTFTIDSVSMIAVAPGHRNMPPVLVKPLDDYLPRAAIGTIGYSIDLRQFVRDPEGGELTFSLDSGPSWAYVQDGNTFFSNYGPKQADVGVSTFRIRATDPKGKSISFTLHVDVVK